MATLWGYTKNLQLSLLYQFGHMELQGGNGNIMADQALAPRERARRLAGWLAGWLPSVHVLVHAYYYTDTQLLYKYVTCYTSF